MLPERGSYGAKHARKQCMERSCGCCKGVENLCPNRLLTDRSSYIGYLETQLERLTDACLTVHAFDKRLEELASGHRQLDEKVMGLAKLVKCAQSLSEQCDDKQKEELSNLQNRIAHLEDDPLDRRMEEKIDAMELKIMGRLDAVLGSTDKSDAQRRGDDAPGSGEASSKGAEPAPVCTPLQMQAAAASSPPAQAFALPSSQAADRRGPMNLAQLSDWLVHIESSLASLASQAASKEELQKSVDCMKMLESMHRVFQKEIQALAEERAQFASSLKQLKLGAPPSPQRTMALKVLGSAEKAVEQEVQKGMKTLSSADGRVQALAQELRHSYGDGFSTQVQPDTPQRPSRDSHPPADLDQPPDVVIPTTAGAARREADAGSSAAALRAAAEAEAVQQVEAVKGTLDGIHSNFAAVRQTLHSVQEALGPEPETTASAMRKIASSKSIGSAAAAAVARHDAEALLPRRSPSSKSLQTGRAPLSRIASSNAAGTPSAVRSLSAASRKLASKSTRPPALPAAKAGVSPRRSAVSTDRPRTPSAAAGVPATISRMQSSASRKTEKASGRPSDKAGKGESNVLERTIMRRRRLQQLYSELQALEEESGKSGTSTPTR